MGSRISQCFVKIRYSLAFRVSLVNIDLRAKCGAHRLVSLDKTLPYNSLKAAVAAALEYLPLDGMSFEAHILMHM